MTPEQMAAMTQVVAAALQQMGIGAQHGGGGGERVQSDRSWNSTVDAIARRVERFKGTNFLEWQFRFEAMLQSTHEGISQLVHWAESRQDVVHPERDLEDGQRMHNKQLYWILAEKTEGEAFDLVKNVQGGTGRRHGASCAAGSLARPAADAYISQGCV